jgi:hypothetical protein
MTPESNSPGPIQPRRSFLGRRTKILALFLVALVGLSVLAGWILLPMPPDIGDPFDINSLIVVQVPDDQNGIVYYRDAAARVVKELFARTDVKSRDALEDGSNATLKNGWSSANKEVRLLLDANAPALELWKSGTRCADAQPFAPVVPTREEADRVLFSTRQLAGMALLEAARVSAEKSPIDAWPWYRAVLCSSRHLALHTGVIGRLAAAGIRAEAVEPVLLWSSQPELTAAQLRGALTEVQAIDATTPPPSHSLQVEYTLNDQDLEALANSMRLPFRWLGYPTRMRRTMNLVYANWLSQIDRPRFRRMPLQGKWDLFALDPAAARDPKVLPPETIEARCGSTKALMPAGIVKLLISPGEGSFVTSTDRERARHAALQLGLALQIFYREHGRFPAALDELVRDGDLKSIPPDPLGKGEPFHYRRESDPRLGAVLWSVWTDGIDQDGKLEADLSPATVHRATGSFESRHRGIAQNLRVSAKHRLDVGQAASLPFHSGKHRQVPKNRKASTAPYLPARYSTCKLNSARSARQTLGPASPRQSNSKSRTAANRQQ